MRFLGSSRCFSLKIFTQIRKFIVKMKRRAAVEVVFTILIEGFVLVLQCFLVLLLELDSFGHFLRIEDWFHCGLILKMFHVKAINKTNDANESVN